MAFLKSGGIGEVYAARGLCFKARDTIGLVPDGLGTGERYRYFVWNKPGVNYDQAYMANVDYDAWLGPAPRRPFNYNRFHYNWHWHWDYGDGDCGNQGPHQWDIARWGLGQDAHPKKIASKGGFYGEKCAQETPNTQAAEMIYADGRMIEFGVRGLYTNGEDGIAIGNLFYGTKGWLRLNGDEWQSYFGRKDEPGPGSKTAGEEDFGDPMAAAAEGGHFANFIKAVQGGRSEAPDLPDRGRLHVLGPAAAGQHLLPPRPQPRLRSGPGEVRRGQTGRPASHPRLPQAVRRAQGRLTGRPARAGAF